MTGNPFKCYACIYVTFWTGNVIKCSRRTMVYNSQTKCDYYTEQLTGKYGEII